MSLTLAAPRPVDVFAELAVDTPAGRLSIRGDGATIAIVADEFRTLRRAAAEILGRRSTRERRLARLLPALRASGTRLSIRLRTREIASVGAGARSGSISRALGLPGVELHPLSLITALLARGA